MSENTLWVIVTTVISSAIVSSILIGTLYWKDHNAKIVQLIGDGVDPVAAMCAMQDDYGQMPVCIVLAAKK